MSQAAEPRSGSRSRVARWVGRLWWLHSLGALAFGVGVMLFARKGLDYADELLVVLGASWLLVFVAFRFIVGASNRPADERIAKKGLRLLTNYVIKQLYQQMFFFLVPIYASAATWSLSAVNWWLAPVLLLCAVLSTMDLVFDNFIMEHRLVAAAMYGLCLFGVLNLMLPLAVEVDHFGALLIAAAATAPTVALLTFRVTSVVSSRGISLTLAASTLLVVGAYFGRSAIAPAPMALVAGGVGHGTSGSYECIPGAVTTMRVTELDGLRCVTRVSSPGGIGEPLVHVWRRGRTEQFRFDPVDISGDAHCGRTTLRSGIPDNDLPDPPVGRWTCSVETEAGQLIGQIGFEIVGAAKE